MAQFCLEEKKRGGKFYLSSNLDTTFSEAEFPTDSDIARFGLQEECFVKYLFAQKTESALKNDRKFN